MSSEAQNDPTICFCHCVLRSEILEAIRAGAATLELIQDETHASTGCGGCECDVRELLDSELTAEKKA